MIDTMPLGKFKGTPIHELPDEYIEWLLNEDWLKNPLKAAIVSEKEKRVFTLLAKRDQIDIPNNILDEVEEIVLAGFRAASLKAHPDQGGDAAKMRKLVEARKWLERSLGL
jgi:hypothetical protein